MDWYVAWLEGPRNPSPDEELIRYLEQKKEPESLFPPIDSILKRTVEEYRISPIPEIVTGSFKSGKKLMELFEHEYTRAEESLLRCGMSGFGLTIEGVFMIDTSRPLSQQYELKYEEDKKKGLDNRFRSFPTDNKEYYIKPENGNFCVIKRKKRKGMPVVEKKLLSSNVKVPEIYITNQNKVLVIRNLSEEIPLIVTNSAETPQNRF